MLQMRVNKNDKRKRKNKSWPGILFLDKNTTYSAFNPNICDIFVPC